MTRHQLLLYFLCSLTQHVDSCLVTTTPWFFSNSSFSTTQSASTIYPDDYISTTGASDRRQDCKVCFETDATAFPGVSWQQVKQNWDTWWDYPCFYYTEEALLSVTDPSYRSILCEGQTHWYSGCNWYFREAIVENYSLQEYLDVYREDMYLEGAGSNLQQFFKNHNYQSRERYCIFFLL